MCLDTEMRAQTHIVFFQDNLRLRLTQTGPRRRRRRTRAHIASVMKRPERLIGLHFFNPVAKMPLVEVVHDEQTDPAVLRWLVERRRLRRGW